MDLKKSSKAVLSQSITGVESIVETALDKGAQVVVVTMGQHGEQNIQDNSQVAMLNGKSRANPKEPGFAFNVGRAAEVEDEKTIQLAQSLFNALPEPKLQSFYRVVMDHLPTWMPGATPYKLRMALGVSENTIRNHSQCLGPKYLLSHGGD
jgi:hypothetical protein